MTSNSVTRPLNLLRNAGVVPPLVGINPITSSIQPVTQCAEEGDKCNCIGKVKFLDHFADSLDKKYIFSCNIFGEIFRVFW